MFICHTFYCLQFADGSYLQSQMILKDEPSFLEIS